MQYSNNISVVIRCKNDPRVFDCISSIDIPAEVVVSYSGQSDLKSKIEQTGAICVNAPYNNLSVVSNIGLNTATGDLLVLTDSDTLFEPGCLRKLIQELKRTEIVKAKTRFLSVPGNIISETIAAARDYVNSLPVVYTPGIALRKDVIEKIQGFFFNEVVPFAVDADLNFRVKYSDVSVSFLDNAYIRHLPVDIKDDFRAAFRIGKGCEKSIRYWNMKGALGHLRSSELKGVKISMLPDLAKKKGIFALLYQIVWDLLYWLGDS